MIPLRQSRFSAAFVQFYVFVNYQFDAKIQIFQSDEGGEFNAKDFTTYLQTHGILHQSSCPKTPEQNGKVERKHRSIIDLGLTMMFHAKLPSHFWLEYFFTAVFLLNRLPSPMLNMDSPFFRLYGKHPDYSLLHTLGSRCFLYLGDYTGLTSLNQNHCHVCLLATTPNIKATDAFIHPLAASTHQDMFCLMSLSCHISQPTMLYDSPLI